MPRPPIDLARKIKDIVQHVQPLPAEANAPILHFQRAVSDIWASLAYFERALDEGDRYETAVRRHLGRLYGMALVSLVETFERFLKEAASECVDCLAGIVVDDRFNVFAIQGSTLASHFGTETLGKSLCESITWLDCEEINKRFRRLLSDPFESGQFNLFPKQPPDELARFETMNLVWQIRHTAVHNVGVITQSDAVKMRLWAKETVAAPCILSPTRGDLNYLKRFIDETARRCNRQIGERLARLLTLIHAASPTLFDPQQMAGRIASAFRLPLTVAGSTGVIPPD